MTIDKLVSDPINARTLTVTLTYGECRDLANATYWAKESAQEKNRSEEILGLEEICIKAAILFDMIKCGNIQTHTARKLVEFDNKIKSKAAVDDFDEDK